MKNKKKKIKLKYKEISIAFLGLVATGKIVYDFILIFILHKATGWTWFGFFLFTISLIYLVYCFDYFYVKKGGE